MAAPQKTILLIWFVLSNNETSMYETKIDELISSGRPGGKFKTILDQKLVTRIASSLNLHEDQINTYHLLEVGTGSGRLARQLLGTNQNLIYTGIEPTSTLRNATAENLLEFESRANLIDSSLPELENVQNDSFDGCLMFHLLEHATDQIQAHRWLSSIIQKLKPGGRVIIVCPNHFDYRSYFYDVDWSHGYPTTTRRIELLGRDAGFNSLEATDLRANSDNLFIRGILWLFSKIIPTGLVNHLGRKIFGVQYLGLGVQSALFWRNSWVVLERPR